ncbi:MAG: type II toxin-antitoxin system RelE/ParE family toxin [Nitrospirota bacterium]
MPRRTTLVWTRPALDALLDAVRYIKRDKPLAAERFAALIRAKVGRLRQYPESGRLVAEFPASGLREIVVEDYRIIYRVQQGRNRVDIVTLRHGTRQLEPPTDAP